VQTAPLDVLEGMFNRSMSAIAGGRSIAAAEIAINTRSHLEPVLVRIRNRVNTFLGAVLHKIQFRNTRERRTGKFELPDLSEFTADLPVVLAEASKHCTIAFIDIDNFKQLNIRLTHDGADKVIAGVAETLARSARFRGTVYHRSGDEFLAILQNHTSAEAVLFFERVCRQVAETGYEGLLPGEVTISVGIAEHEMHAVGVDDLREAANRANLVAKTSGKNRVSVPDGKGPTT
jgi:diguanylate cyclase (GGDEF)-like protein